MDLSVGFHISHFLLWNCWTEFEENWQVARSPFHQHVPSLCIARRSETQDVNKRIFLLRLFRPLLWNGWTELNETWYVKKDINVLYQFCFFFLGLIGKARKPPPPVLVRQQKLHIVLRCTICGLWECVFIFFFALCIICFLEHDKVQVELCKPKSGTSTTNYSDQVINILSMYTFYHMLGMTLWPLTQVSSI